MAEVVIVTRSGHIIEISSTKGVNIDILRLEETQNGIVARMSRYRPDRIFKSAFDGVRSALKDYRVSGFIRE